MSGGHELIVAFFLAYQNFLNVLSIVNTKQTTWPSTEKDLKH